MQSLLRITNFVVHNSRTKILLPPSHNESPFSNKKVSQNECSLSNEVTNFTFVNYHVLMCTCNDIMWTLEIFMYICATKIRKRIPLFPWKLKTDTHFGKEGVLSFYFNLILAKVMGRARLVPWLFCPNVHAKRGVFTLLTESSLAVNLSFLCLSKLPNYAHVRHLLPFVSNKSRYYIHIYR